MDGPYLDVGPTAYRSGPSKDVMLFHFDYLEVTCREELAVAWFLSVPERSKDAAATKYGCDSHL